MELILRGSEYQDFLNCRKKWYYSWVEGIEPVKPDNKLFFGTMFHKWLEYYYQGKCNKLEADLLTSVWINEQDTSGMEQTALDEQTDLLKGVAAHYHDTYGESDSKWKVLATELEFLCMLEEGLFMTGTIDLLYEVDGKVRFSDHKTVSSLSLYEEKSKMDRQISRYWFALKLLSAGIARVKDKQTDLWVTWHDFLGKDIDGFDYNLIMKDYPREPRVLKSGALSTDKAQKTTYEKYLKKLQELGKDSNDYVDILSHLASKPDPFLKRVDVIRTDKELESAAWEFNYTAGDIHDVRTLLEDKPELVEALTYRNIGTQCSQMCQFKSLCQTTIEGGHVSMVKSLGYKKKEEK